MLHAEALGNKFDHVIKLVKVNQVSSFEHIWQHLSTWCSIPRFKVISLLVPKKKIFKDFFLPYTGLETMLNLILYTSYLSQYVKNSYEYVTFWHMWHIRTCMTILKFKYVRMFHKYLIFDLWKIRTYLSHLGRIRAHSSHVWRIRAILKKICTYAWSPKMFWKNNNSKN